MSKMYDFRVTDNILVASGSSETIPKANENSINN